MKAPLAGKRTNKSITFQRSGQNAVHCTEYSKIKV